MTVTVWVPDGDLVDHGAAALPVGGAVGPGRAVPAEPEADALPLGGLLRLAGSGAFTVWAATVTCFVC